jgi:hypothetical protein
VNPQKAKGIETEYCIDLDWTKAELLWYLHISVQELGMTDLNFDKKGMK